MRTQASIHRELRVGSFLVHAYVDNEDDALSRSNLTAKRGRKRACLDALDLG